MEASAILGPLTDPSADLPFDVVAVSLPGYGFSPHRGRPGLGPAEIADLLATLTVEVLAYERFVVQGGDWGAFVGSHLAARHPDRVLGLHLNLPAAQPRLDGDAPPLSQAEQDYLRAARRWSTREGAYAAIHATKPDSLAAALNDSPAGLAAWIVEKFWSWSDCGDVERVYSKDDLLTHIMIYWVTGSIGTSMRLYLDAARGGMAVVVPPGNQAPVPTAYARFPADILVAPREWMERSYHLVQYTEFPSGGHFAALERPTELVADLRSFARLLPGVPPS